MPAFSSAQKERSANFTQLYDFILINMTIQFGFVSMGTPPVHFWLARYSAMWNCFEYVAIRQEQGLHPNPPSRQSSVNTRPVPIWCVEGLLPV
jgi:hypothetical protein